MDDDDFNWIYQRACEEIDHGNPRYGHRLVGLIEDEMVARGVTVPGGVA